MIIVTGATGQLGRLVVERLVERVPASQVGVSVRDPARAGDLAGLGVRVRRGDFAEPDSLRDAFEGASQVFLVSSNARATGGDTLAQHRTAIDAARAVGAGRIVYTSQMAANSTSKFPPALDHAATEAMLAESGVRWTALRHGFYAASGLAMTADGIEKGLIEAPEDGPVAWTAHAGLAEADAAILAEVHRGDGARWDGPTPPLTGPEAIDLAQLAAIATEELGQPVARKVLTADEMRARVAARGAPPSVAAIALGLYTAAREGEFDKVDLTLELLIGRRPRTMRDLLVGKNGG